MSFGIGAFPFGFFATNLNWGENGAGHGAPAPGSAQEQEEQFLHRVFLWVAFAFIFWLLIA
jgi:E3 ubiquitin-protein ligase RNF5